jgi:4-methylaminobutanoate oxidase (formaldehyde-forming)
MPGDGAADPSGVTHMLAKAARMEGAQIFERSPVDEILTKNGKITGDFSKICAPSFLAALANI